MALGMNRANAPLSPALTARSIDCCGCCGPQSQWPTDELPYSVIAFKELGLCETMLGKEFPSTLTSINNLAAVLRDQGTSRYYLVEEMY
jgi:hypothetical protein